jgi:hypothetical protein
MTIISAQDRERGRRLGFKSIYSFYFIRRSFRLIKLTIKGGKKKYSLKGHPRPAACERVFFWLSSSCIFVILDQNLIENSNGNAY